MLSSSHRYTDQTAVSSCTSGLLWALSSSASRGALRLGGDLLKIALSIWPMCVEAFVPCASRWERKGEQTLQRGELRLLCDALPGGNAAESEAGPVSSRLGARMLRCGCCVGQHLGSDCLLCNSFNSGARFDP